MQARLYIRVRLGDGTHPFVDPVYASNHKIKPQYALVGGKPEHHPEGSYYLRYLRQGRRIWESVGTDARSAVTALRKRNAMLQAAEAEVQVVEESDPLTVGRPILPAITQYLAEVKAAKAHKTYLAYSVTLRAYAAACKATTLEQMSRTDVLAYMGAQMDSGASRRTIANRVTYVRTFFLHFDLAWPMRKTDKIKYTEKTVEAYSTDDLCKLFAVADQDETDLFQFLLCTGFREQEAMHATWRDVDFARKRIKVSEKLDQGFTPKDKEEGNVPVPDSLLSLLQARRKRYPHSRLIFGLPDGSVDTHCLRKLKRLAHRAGLNCGECYDHKNRSCESHASCHRWGLHRFRKTFATMHHEAGVPVRTIQRWLRHSSLDTTLRYLAGSDDTSDRTRSLVNTTFGMVGGAYAA